MMIQSSTCQPGRRVRITQQVPHHDTAWASAVEGVITRFRQQKTGSWFAHAKDDQLWLDRLELRSDDGELTILNLDQFTKIELIEPDADDAPAD